MEQRGLMGLAKSLNAATVAFTVRTSFDFPQAGLLMAS